MIKIKMSTSRMRSRSVFHKKLLAKYHRNTFLFALGLCCFSSLTLADNVLFDVTPQSVNSSSLNEAASVVVADVDNDNDQDIVAIGSDADTVVWYENADGAGTTWNEFVIDSTVGAPTQLRVVNMDADPELEVIVSATGATGSGGDDFIYLYDASVSPVTVPWTRSEITDFADVNTRPNAIDMVDIDSDGDLDVVAALFATNEFTWYENPEINPPVTPNPWVEHLIEDVGTSNPRFVIAADIDGDEFIDIVSATFGTSDQITWHESTDDGENWTQVDLSTQEAVSLAAADINGDDKTDIVAALRTIGAVVVLEQPATDPDSNSWNETTVSAAVPQARSVAIGDIDNDCDPDIASVAFGDDNNGTNSQIFWHDNPLNGANTDWDTYNIGQTGNFGAFTVALADVDGDGNEGDCPGVANRDLDVVAALFTADSISLYRNQRLGAVVITDSSDQPLAAALSVDESGPDSQSFKVALSVQPAVGSTVTVPVVLPVTPAGEITLDKTSLDFTDADWDSPQTVTITAIDDAIDDDDQNFNISFGTITTTGAGDPAYDDFTPADLIAVTTVDDDTAAITVSEISGPTSEAGDTATFTVVLTSEPVDDVTIAVVSSDSTEGDVDKASLTFTSGDWDQAQTVTVIGQDDQIEDGNVNYSIQLTMVAGADAKYNAIDPADVDAVNNDDADTAGVTVDPTSGLTTSETGTTDTFTVVLNSEPVDDITIDVVSSDSTEGDVDKASLTFTSADWDQDQTVTITGQNDQIDDGDISYSIQLTMVAGADANYNVIDPADVDATNTDDADTVGINTGTISGSTSENGDAATFTVALNSEPVADIVIAMESLDTTEGTVNPASLTLTPANWDQPQAVTVTGENDDEADGDVTYDVQLTVSNANGDNLYAALGVVTVAVTNTDNDNASEIIFDSGGFED